MTFGSATLWEFSTRSYGRGTYYIRRLPTAKMPFPFLRDAREQFATTEINYTNTLPPPSCTETIGKVWKAQKTRDIFRVCAESAAENSTHWAEAAHCLLPILLNTSAEVRHRSWRAPWPALFNCRQRSKRRGRVERIPAPSFPQCAAGFRIPSRVLLSRMTEIFRSAPPPPIAALLHCRYRTQLCDALRRLTGRLRFLRPFVAKITYSEELIVEHVSEFVRANGHKLDLTHFVLFQITNRAAFGAGSSRKLTTEINSVMLPLKRSNGPIKMNFPAKGEQAC